MNSQYARARDRPRVWIRCRARPYLGGRGTASRRRLLVWVTVLYPFRGINDFGSPFLERHILWWLQHIIAIGFNGRFFQVSHIDGG